MEQNELIGMWTADPNDYETQQLYGSGASIEFRASGELVYTIIENGRQQEMLMTYEIIGNHLITDQPSMPNKEVTVFSLLEDRLELDYEGAKSIFIRSKR
jgi:hypothetical protein